MEAALVVELTLIVETAVGSGTELVVEAALVVVLPLVVEAAVGSGRCCSADTERRSRGRSSPTSRRSRVGTDEDSMPTTSVTPVSLMMREVRFHAFW